MWGDMVRISMEQLLYVLGLGALTSTSLTKWNVVEKEHKHKQTEHIGKQLWCSKP